MSFKGKVVVITGAASGIGLAVVKKLAPLGATLAITDINEAALSQAVRCCGQEYFSKIFNVGATEETNAFVVDVIDRYGRIDHVFNCAGVNPTAMPLEEVTDEYWNKLMDTNLKGIFHMTRACIPHLKSGASFVNVSSIMGVRGSAKVRCTPSPHKVHKLPLLTHSKMAVYCATKWGVIGFSKSMALELGPKGIRTNVIAPGYIDTPTNASVVKGKDAVEQASKEVAMERFGTVEEVADVVAFLFSEESRYVNGSVVEINGGMQR